MRRFVFILLLGGIGIVVLAGMPYSAAAQSDPPRTLVPPTLLPPVPTGTPYPAITRSALARVQSRDPQTLIVGAFANRPPFSTITDTGDYEGFEADIARAIAEDWGVKIAFQQVTRLNAYARLQAGEIDLLIGAQIITRDAPDFLDFSDPYFVGRQVALGMADTQGDIVNLSGQTVGVVIGSPGEAAFTRWSTASGVAANVSRYAMLDDALRDLGDRKIFAVVADRWELDQRVRGKIEGVRLLGGDFVTEPYGVALLRYDENLRTAVNRTLQRLVKSERLKQIYDRWFPPGLMPDEDRVYPAVWRDLDADTRQVTCLPGSADCQAFPLDVVRPARSVVDKIKAGEPVMVAGLGLPVDASGRTSPLETFNAALVYEMARRWGAPVALVPNSYATAEDVLASGGGDFAVGLTPHWGLVDRFEYVGVYAERGYKMMVRINSDLANFGGLRYGKRAIATFIDDPQAFEIARQLALSVGIPERTVQHVQVRDENEAIQAVFEIQSARVLFGDALRVIPLARANPARVQLTGTLYDKRPLSFGVPRNDVAFRMLVEATLQAMVRDGTYQRFWDEYWNLDTPPKIVIVPGGDIVAGIKTTG